MIRLALVVTDHASETAAEGWAIREAIETAVSAVLVLDLTGSDLSPTAAGLLEKMIKDRT